MLDRKTMTLNLSEPEMVVLDGLAERKGLSKTALLRQALRLYQSVDARLERGEKIFFEHPLSKDKAELVVL
jgi:hypothetical protein